MTESDIRRVVLAVLSPLSNVANGIARLAADGRLPTANAPGIAKSGEIVGNGGVQNYAHGLGVVPRAVVVYPTDTNAASFVVTEGAHTNVNAIVTVPNGSKYRVVAFA